VGNRGLLRGRGGNVPLGLNGEVVRPDAFAGEQQSQLVPGQLGFIQGPYPTQPWTSRTPRPTVNGMVIHAPHNPNKPGLQVLEVAQSANVGVIRSLMGVSDAAGIPIAQVFNAGGLLVSGDKITAATGIAPGVSNQAGVDGTTIPSALFGNTGATQPYCRIYFSNGVPSGTTLPSLSPNAGDLCINQAGAVATSTTAVVTGPPNTVTVPNGSGVQYQYNGSAWVPMSTINATIVNGSSAALQITLPASGIDGQRLIVRVYDFANTAETLTWVNTNNSEFVSVPGTSRGNSLAPLFVGFINNLGTAWSCVAVS
jgi:hypothetical protein